MTTSTTSGRRYSRRSRRDSADSICSARWCWGLVELVIADDWASDPARMKLIQSEPALLLVNQIESDRAISEAADFIADYLGVERDNPRLRVFIAAVGGMMFHIANGTENVRDGRFLESLLEAIDLLEQGLPL